MYIQYCIVLLMAQIRRDMVGLKQQIIGFCTMLLSHNDMVVTMLIGTCRWIAFIDAKKYSLLWLWTVISGYYRVLSMVVDGY